MHDKSRRKLGQSKSLRQFLDDSLVSRLADRKDVRVEDMSTAVQMNSKKLGGRSCGSLYKVKSGRLQSFDFVGDSTTRSLVHVCVETEALAISGPLDLVEDSTSVEVSSAASVAAFFVAASTLGLSILTREL